MILSDYGLHIEVEHKKIRPRDIIPFLKDRHTGKDQYFKCALCIFDVKICDFIFLFRGSRLIFEIKNSQLIKDYDNYMWEQFIPFLRTQKIDYRISTI